MFSFPHAWASGDPLATTSGPDSCPYAHDSVCRFEGAGILWEG